MRLTHTQVTSCEKAYLCNFLKWDARASFLSGLSTHHPRFGLQAKTKGKGLVHVDKEGEVVSERTCLVHAFLDLTLCTPLYNVINVEIKITCICLRSKWQALLSKP